MDWRGSRARALAAVVAVVFGVVTIGTGTRVLLGSDPGYVVYRPLLVFNTTMGIFYVIVGLVAWRKSRLGVYGAAGIAALNLIALCVIAYLYTPEGSIAGTSLQAMAFRTVVWIVLVIAFARALGTNAGRTDDD